MVVNESPALLRAIRKGLYSGRDVVGKCGCRRGSSSEVEKKSLE